MTRNHEQELRRLISETCRREVGTIDLDTDLAGQLGLDSLTKLRLLALIEKRFAIRFPNEQLGQMHTLRQLLEAIDAQQREAVQ